MFGLDAHPCHQFNPVTLSIIDDVRNAVAPYNLDPFVFCVESVAKLNVKKAPNVIDMNCSGHSDGAVLQKSRKKLALNLSNEESFGTCAKAEIHVAESFRHECMDAPQCPIDGKANRKKKNRYCERDEQRWYRFQFRKDSIPQS